MQTPAEIHLIKSIVGIFGSYGDSRTVKMLNIGAGKSVVVEEHLLKAVKNKFICDRVDVIDCVVEKQYVGDCHIASVESMDTIETGKYDLAFANYVLEHVADLEKASDEIARVLKPSGYFIASLPNASAPEFILSKYTPTKFHQLIKGEGDHAHETQYAYKNIKEFISRFEDNFSSIEIKYWPNTYGYLYRFPVINVFSAMYDSIIKFLNIKILMGNVCVVLRKKD